MDITQISWAGVALAAISAFVLGGVWYGPLFGKIWMRHAELTDEDLKRRNMPMVFGVSFLLMLLAAINLEMFIGPEGTASFGLFAGFMAALGWVAAYLGVIYLFEKKTLRGFLINAGYTIVSLSVMGIILGAI